MRVVEEKGWPLEEVFARVRGLGYEAVEVDGDQVRNMAKLNKQLKDTGMAVSCIYSVYDWSSHPEDMRDFRLIKLAKKLGAARIMPIPGFFSEDAVRDPEKHEAELKNMMEGMKTLVRAAGEAGIAVTIEDYDHALSPISTMAGMRRFLDAVPELEVTLDTGNFFFSGEDVLDAYPMFRSRMRHVHLKDRMIGNGWDGEKLERTQGTPSADINGMLMYPCAVGDGVIPVAEILRQLFRDGYEGYVTAEHFGSAGPWEMMCASAEYVRTWIWYARGREDSGD